MVDCFFQKNWLFLAEEKLWGGAAYSIIKSFAEMRIHSLIFLTWTTRA